MQEPPQALQAKRGEGRRGAVRRGMPIVPAGSTYNRERLRRLGFSIARRSSESFREQAGRSTLNSRIRPAAQRPIHGAEWLLFLVQPHHPGPFP
jgi:hypothetical protein